MNHQLLIEVIIVYALSIGLYIASRLGRIATYNICWWEIRVYANVYIPDRDKP